MYFVLTLVMYLVAGGLAIYFFALIDFCWTMIEEGEIVTIMVNKKAWKFIGSIKGHLVNEETGEVTLGDEKFPWYSLKNLGIYWMGFWPFFRRYVYRFKWVKYSKTNDPNGVTYNFEARDAMVSTLLFRFPYGFKFEAVETKGKIGLTFEILATTQVANAEKMLFKTNDWLAQVAGAISEALIDYVGAKEWEEISGAGTNSIREAMVQSIRANLTELKEKYGVEIADLDVLSIEVVGSAEEKAATTAKYVAAQRGEAMKVTADADAYATTVKGNAEAGAITAKGNAEAATRKLLFVNMGEAPNGAQLALAEALRVTKGTIVINSGGPSTGVLPTINVTPPSLPPQQLPPQADPTQSPPNPQGSAAADPNTP